MAVEWWDNWGKDVAGIGATLGAGYMAYQGAQQAGDQSAAAFEAAQQSSVPWFAGLQLRRCLLGLT